MASLSYFLERIQQSNESLQELEFSSPGIFTNAFIKSPPITQLLKDANPNEASLYRITHQYNQQGYLDTDLANDDMVPERVDGKRYFEEDDNQYLVNDNIDEDIKRTAINVPRLTNVPPSSSGLSSELNSSPTRAKAVDSRKMNEIYEQLMRTMNKIPNLQENQPFLNEVNQLRLEYQQLLQDIDQLEKISDDQKQQLNEYNMGELKTSDDFQEVDLDELIRQEELEIIKTQKKLDELTNI